jgi:hypothetical protein
MKTTKDIYDAVATPFPQCDAVADNVVSGKKFFSTVAGNWGVQTGTLVSGAYTWRTLLKTGQTTSYVTGDDASKNRGAAFSYTDSGSGLSVTDNVTGLIWAKSGTGDGCNGGAALSWTAAVNWAVGLTFDGYSDWRLPNITEIQSLMVRDAGHGAPYINTTFFPGTVSGGYWSSTTYPLDTTGGLYGVVNQAKVLAADKAGTNYVRAVRGGE